VPNNQWTKPLLAAITAGVVLALAIILTLAPKAQAADLSGTCCQDLEERVAELEATVARKGNRKVSLTVSGWVAEQVVHFDDGVNKDTYVGGLGSTLATNVKFTGQATISPGWTAGYVLQLEAITTESAWVSANDTGDDGGVYVLQSYWFIKSDQVGKVGIGKQSSASDNAALLVDGSGSVVPANWVMFEGRSMALNATYNGNSGVVGSWGDVVNCVSSDAGLGGDCNGVPLNVVRYDSPAFAGFSFSASWGEDDMWDVAARYAGEYGGFKLAAVVAYSDVNRTESFGFFDYKTDAKYTQGALYVQHVATGLFAYGAYGQEQIDGTQGDLLDLIDTFAPGWAAEDKSEQWYVKAGIRQRWTGLGHTVLYGEYQEATNKVGLVGGDGFDLVNLCGAIACDPKYTSYGAGVVQEIDAANMAVWLTYRHHEFDVDIKGVDGLEFKDAEVFKFGALVNF
jgi:hypothetical protein